MPGGSHSAHVVVSARNLRLLGCTLAAVLFSSEPSVGVSNSNVPFKVVPTVATDIAAGLACPVTSGPLTLRVSAVRNSGISPFLMFFDATGTTDTSITGNTTTFQDVTYTWN